MVRGGLTLFFVALTACGAEHAADTGTDGASGAGGSGNAGGSGPVACDEADCLSREIATWPMPNSGTLGLPNPARLDAGAESVRDRHTELEWAVAVAPLGTYADAGAFCDGLQVDETPGFRLPTRIELVSLLDRTRLPAIDTRAFPNTPDDYFWTATPLPGAPGFRYSVYFGAGETSSGDESQASAYTRCVRGGRRLAPPRYELAADTAHDLGTGLVWQRAVSRDTLSLDAAARFCAGLEASQPDWRLPSDKELQTLVTTGETATNGAALIDGQTFPDTPAAPHATAHTEPLPPVAVDFATGFATVVNDTDRLYVRCVR